VDPSFEGAIGCAASGGEVDDLNGSVADQVVAVALEEVLRRERPPHPLLAPARTGERAREGSGQLVEADPPEVELSTSRERSGSEELVQAARQDTHDHVEREATEARFATVRSHQMLQALDQIREEMAEDAALVEGEQETVVSSAEKVAVAFSVGLLGVLLRGSSLAAVALSSLPIWRRVDPLAILALSDEERRKRVEELRSAQETEDSGEEAVGRLLD
jgi:hypothetical protein